MKFDLSIPAVNVICDALRCLQQQAAVALEQISIQANAQQTPPPAAPQESVEVP